MNEIELIRRASRGDERAFEELVRAHDRSVLTTALTMTGSALDAQDVYQETFIRAYKGLRRFRFDSSFRTWLLRIAVNQAINLRRKRRRQRMLSLDAPAHDSGGVAAELLAAEDPQRELLDGEIQERVLHAMAALTPRERAVFSLKHMQHYKLKQIAVILDCAEGTVKNLLFRAVQKMRAELTEYQRGNE